MESLCFSSVVMPVVLSLAGGVDVPPLPTPDLCVPLWLEFWW